MNRGDFIQLVEKKIPLQSEHLVDLQAIIHEFPYFQTGQLLLSKAFQNTENINFEKQLRKTAAFAANRKVLHELLFQQNPLEGNIPERVQDELESSSLIETTDIHNEIAIESVEEEVKAVTGIDQAIAPNNDSEVEEKDKTLEQQILSSAISSSIFLEVSEELDLEGFQIAPKESFEAKKTSDSSIENQESSFSEQTAHSFNEWLAHFSNKVEETTLEWDKNEDSEETYTYEESNLPAKSEFYSPAKMARLSVQENDDLVTETLANIYADQGSYEKAIKAFQKLQLKYPEKKIYFAARIKEIENQLNSQ
ncbi:MAG: hypothetical protein KDB74_08945 [Flavobacteriales bacterium]|nr:hypothetical protein [Flavobacteriales bacterium]